MANWTSTTHSIADIKEWADDNKLLIQPTYQRNTIWNNAAKIMLIDSILKNIPIPKVFLAKNLDGAKSIRKVIDGQQRITSILSFLRDEFALDDPYVGDFFGKKFSELQKDTQEHILGYNIDINEFTNPTEQQEREVYSRINKYTMPLNSQELRQAEFPGDFLDLARDIAELPFWMDYKFFTQTAIKRNLDVEFISETIILLMDGIQDKKAMLDDYYCKYATMKNKTELFDRYKSVLEEITILLDGILQYDGNYLLAWNEETEEQEKQKIKKSRFTQQADFYSLFYAMKEMMDMGGTLKNKNIIRLVEDFVAFDLYIAPESEVSVFKDYAVKCISQANSASSRKWRAEFLKNVLNGTMKLYDIPEQYIINSFAYSHPYNWHRQYCDPFSDSDYSEKGDYIGWDKNESSYHSSNIKLYKEKPSESDTITFLVDKDEGDFHNSLWEN